MLKPPYAVDPQTGTPQEAEVLAIVPFGVTTPQRLPLRSNNLGQIEVARPVSLVDLDGVPFDEEFAGLKAALIDTQQIRDDLGDLGELRSEVTADRLATEIALGQVAGAVAGLNVAASQLLIYRDDSGDTTLPMTVDGELRVLTGFVRATGALSGRGIPDPAPIATLTVGLLQIPDGEPILPIAVDGELRVRFGFDAVTGAIIGLPETGGGGVAAQSYPDMTLTQLALTYGQSWATFNTQDPAISTAPGVHPGALMPSGGVFDVDGYDAANFTSLVPAVEAGFETTVTSSVRSALSHATELVGAAVADWDVCGFSMGNGGAKISFFVPGSAWWTNQVIPAMDDFAGLAPDGEASVMNWLHGGADTLSGGADQPTYEAGMVAILDGYEAKNRALFGHTRRSFMVTVQPTRNSATVDKIVLAQLAVAKRDPRVFIACPAYFFAFSPIDDVHLLNFASAHMGRYIGRADGEIFAGREPKALLDPIGTRRGLTITARYDVPVAPLQLNVTDLAFTADYGFVVRDTIGIIPLASAPVIGADGRSVVFQISRLPVGQTFLRYALDNRAASLPDDGGMAAGNLCDSDPYTTVIAGGTYKMLNWAVHSQVLVTELGE